MKQAEKDRRMTAAKKRWNDANDKLVKLEERRAKADRDRQQASRDLTWLHDAPVTDEEEVDDDTTDADA